MDRADFKKKLGAVSVQDAIIKQLQISKVNADSIVKDEFDKSIKEIEECSFNDGKIFLCVLNINKTKKELIDRSYSDFEKIIRESKKYSYTKNWNKNTEFDELKKVAEYIVAYHDFMKTTDFAFENYLNELYKISLKYYVINGFFENIKKYFDIVNELNDSKDFYWKWENFENGLNRLLQNHFNEKVQIKSKCDLEINKYKSKAEFEKERLTSEITTLEKEIISLNGSIALQKEYFDKYYYKSEIILNQTYFGDNMPFLFNLFNFLKRNNLLVYNWSYFYSCFIIGNKEMISLEKPKKNSFIGRIFYHFPEFLVLHYKENPMQFIKSKFLINETNITDSFKNNHMKPRNLNTDDPDPELDLVDDFFEKQKKIYLKM